MYAIFWQFSVALQTEILSTEISDFLRQIIIPTLFISVIMNKKDDTEATLEANMKLIDR